MKLLTSTLSKEPVYHSKPQYFLLVFGPETKKRIWVVLDGEDFYMDTNGNGDLTEAGKRGKIPGDVEIEGDGNSPITLSINPPNREGTLCCFAYVQGRYIQNTAIQPAGRPEDAPVYHFQGPLCIDLIAPEKLIRTQINCLEVVIGTPPEKRDRIKDWVTIWQSESIPPSVNPHVEIEFPSKENGTPPIMSRILLRRTGQATFLGTVQVPDEAGPGNAKVFLSFPDWKGFDVAPSVRELPLSEADPGDEEMAKWWEGQPRLIDEETPIVDLAKIDRSVPPEPAYKAKPRYCLLLLGHEARTRTWLVLDGDTLYVDRNGRGDWIEADKQVKRQTILFTVREIQELDGTKHNDLKVYAEQSRLHPGRYDFKHVGLTVKGQYEEYTCIGSVADCNSSVESPREAPIRHFNGPLRMELGNLFLSVRNHQPTELNARISTRLPSGEWVFIDSHQGIPPDVHPVAEIEFPNRESGEPPVKLKMALTQRC